MSYDDDDAWENENQRADITTFERASKALSKFKTMQHSLTTYARAITGRGDMQIEASTEPGIHGNQIKFMPPIELADERVHHVSLCDRRGENGLQLCEACAADEAVMARIYHDLAHVAFHSFDQPGGFKKKATRTADEVPYETFMEKAEAEYNVHVKNVLMGFEDSRVNREIFAARPGVRGMYEAMITNTVENGAEITTTDPKTKKSTTELVQWADMSADFQIVLGMNLKMVGFDPSEWLHPEVVADLADEDLNGYMDIVKTNVDVRDNYRDAKKVYDYLKTLGYFKDDEDPPEPEPEDGDGEGDGDGEPSIKDDKGRPSPDSGCLADQIAPMSDEEKEAMAEATQDESKNEMQRAIVQSEHFEKPSVEVGGVKIVEYGSEPHWPEFNGRRAIHKPAESLLGGALMKMRAAFEDNLRARNLKHLKSGKINARVLGRRAAVEDPRLFRKKSIPAKKDYFVIIGMDLSGSTSDGSIWIEQKVVAAQAELLHRLNIPFSIIGHSGHYNILSGSGYYTEWDYSGGMHLLIFPVKTEQQKWDSAAKARLFATKPVGANLDGHALEYLRKRADESHSLQKIIIYGSDGAMPMENYHEELEILKRELKTCKQRKHIVLGLGINTDSPRQHGLDTVIVRSDNDIGSVIRQLDKYIRTV